MLGRQGQSQTWSLCLMFENIDWFQESSISFRTTDSSAVVFLDTGPLVLPCMSHWDVHGVCALCIVHCALCM